jgi:hypothetical protein
MQVHKCYDLEAAGDACSLPYEVTVWDASAAMPLPQSLVKPTFFKREADGTECGACALYDMQACGLASVKIVGRQFNETRRLSDTRFIKGARELLKDKGISREDFFLKVQERYRSAYNYSGPCRGNNCYHPGVCIR